MRLGDKKYRLSEFQHAFVPKRLDDKILKNGEFMNKKQRIKSPNLSKRYRGFQTSTIGNDLEFPLRKNHSYRTQ